MKYNRKWVRMWKVLSLAFSVIAQIYWYKILKKPGSEWDKLWEKVGKQYRETLFTLEGLLIKVGQFLSMRADLLPSPFIRQIQDLVDHVPPSPWEEINNVLENEWGAPIEDKLLSIDQQAIASASIGEVYRGKLKDGTEVAIKVQRPTIQSIIKTDFRSLQIIIWFAHHFAPVPKGFISFKMLYQELKSVIERELDFNKEYDTVNHFRHRFHGIHGLEIPKVYPELSTSKVLVMEWMDGVRVTNEEFLEKSQIDRKELAERLFRIFIPQWLEAGVFHADPHAGNVMVKPDGTLVLLDFGMVGEISKNDASNFQDLLQAFLVKNYTMAAEILIDLGFLLPEADQKVISKMLKEVMTFDLAKLKEQDIFKVKKDLNNMVKSLPIQVPTRFIFLGRSFVTIEGILLTIHPEAELLEIAKRPFLDWLNQSNQNKWKLIIDWINALPIFQFFHSISDKLDAPQRLLEQQEVIQQREFRFLIYENQKKQAFYLGMLGIIGVFTGDYIHNSIMWIGSIWLIGISLLGYVVCSWRQRKWIKCKK
jgi:predicted unusual protein kinase regulating ubiquinone biosynthesis (AarF/ABC1/UbiB family)